MKVQFLSLVALLVMSQAHGAADNQLPALAQGVNQELGVFRRELKAAETVEALEDLSRRVKASRSNAANRSVISFNPKIGTAFDVLQASILRRTEDARNQRMDIDDSQMGDDR